MSEKTKTVMEKYGEWVFRTVLLLLVVVQLWLTQNFVTRNEYKEDQHLNLLANIAIQTSVNDISATLKITTVQQLQVGDHETRLRVVEQRQSDVVARLSATEKSLSSRP